MAWHVGVTVLLMVSASVYAQDDVAHSQARAPAPSDPFKQGGCWPKAEFERKLAAVNGVLLWTATGNTLINYYFGDDNPSRMSWFMYGLAQGNERIGWLGVNMQDKPVAEGPQKECLWLRGRLQKPNITSPVDGEIAKDTHDYVTRGADPARDFCIGLRETYMKAIDEQYSEMGGKYMKGKDISASRRWLMTDSQRAADDRETAAYKAKVDREGDVRCDYIEVLQQQRMKDMGMRLTSIVAMMEYFPGELEPRNTLDTGPVMALFVNDPRLGKERYGGWKLYRVNGETGAGVLYGAGQSDVVLDPALRD